MWISLTKFFAFLFSCMNVVFSWILNNCILWLSSMLMLQRKSVHQWKPTLLLYNSFISKSTAVLFVTLGEWAVHVSTVFLEYVPIHVHYNISIIGFLFNDCKNTLTLSCILPRDLETLHVSQTDTLLTLFWCVHCLFYII